MAPCKPLPRCQSVIMLHILVARCMAPVGGFSTIWSDDGQMRWSSSDPVARTSRTGTPVLIEGGGYSIPMIFHRSHRYPFQSLVPDAEPPLARVRLNLESCVRLNPTAVSRYDVRNPSHMSAHRVEQLASLLIAERFQPELRAHTYMCAHACAHSVEQKVLRRRRRGFADGRAVPTGGLRLFQFFGRYLKCSLLSLDRGAFSWLQAQVSRASYPVTPFFG